MGNYDILYGMKPASIHHRNFRHRHPEYTFNANLKAYHGISLAQYEALMAEHQGRCAICRMPFDFAGRIRIDHVGEAKTSPVKGLLCQPCYSFTHYVGYDITFLENALAYMKASRPLHLPGNATGAPTGQETVKVPSIEWINDAPDITDQPTVEMRAIKADNDKFNPLL